MSGRKEKALRRAVAFAARGDDLNAAATAANNHLSEPTIRQVKRALRITQKEAQRALSAERRLPSSGEFTITGTFEPSASI